MQLKDFIPLICEGKNNICFITIVDLVPLQCLAESGHSYICQVNEWFSASPAVRKVQIETAIWYSTRLGEILKMGSMQSLWRYGEISSFTSYWWERKLPVWWAINSTHKHCSAVTQQAGAPGTTHPGADRDSPAGGRRPPAHALDTAQPRPRVVPGPRQEELGRDSKWTAHILPWEKFQDSVEYNMYSKKT